MTRIKRRLLLLAALLFLGFLVWGGYYICNHGFSRHWRLRVSQEFRQRGLDLYVHRITLDPIQGFVARDVQIFDTNDPSKVMATIDRAALDLNLTNLFQSRPFIDAVDLRNADLSLPVDPNDPDSERVKVSHLNARIIFPPHEWYVSQAEATMYGVQVSARGRLLNPEAFNPPEQRDQNHPSTGRPQMALDFLKQLEMLHSSGAPPRVEISFGGDLADLSTLYADATIWAEKIHRNTADTAELTRVYAAVALRDRVIELKQCNLNDPTGELDASGALHLDNGQAALELRSTLSPDIATHLLKITNPLQDWNFVTPPEIELSGSGAIGPTPKGLLTGHVRLGGFAVRETHFTGAGADFSWDGARWYVQNGWLSNRTGLVQGRAMSLPGNFRARIDSGINPNSLRTLFSGPAADGMRDWDFRQTPKVALTITGTSANPTDWQTHGHVTLGRTLMRHVPLNWGVADVDVKGLLFTYRNFTVQREEGAAYGTSFSYDFDKHEAWLNNVHAHLNTTEAAVWINPDLPRQLAPYRFKAAPTVTLNGFVQCANDQGTHLDVHVDAPAGMDYTFCKRDLSFPRLAGDVQFREHEILLKNISTNLCGGSVRGAADIRLGQNSPGYTAHLQVSQMNFASVTKLYFNYANSQGLVDAAFDFGGKNDDPWTLYGNGQVRVTEGNVFAIPVLGPFSSILNTIVPGMGYNVAHAGSCTFSIRDGIITTHDFLVKGLGFSMIGDGRLMFLEDRLAFNIRLNAQGLPGVLLFPVSKLLEYAGTGTLESPVWKPVLLQQVSSRRPLLNIVAPGH